MSDFQRGAWDVASEAQNARGMLAEAERAAGRGDLASAEDLLKKAAQLQEAELGSLHPDLANTLNNLAILAEKTGRRDEAETLYRRAVAIAAAALPPDDPIVASSRQNLEEFCRANGLPLDRPEASPEPAAIEPVTIKSPTIVTHATTVEPAGVEVHASPAPAIPTPLPPISQMRSRALAALAIGAVVLVAAFFVARSRPPRQVSAPVPVAKPATPSPAEPSRPVPRAAPPGGTTPPAKPATGSAVISLVAVQLCRTFSASDFRCDAAGDSVAPGPIVLLTRVRSPNDSVIVHRWYQGDTLRKSAQLRIGANGAEGYRTYSRQTVGPGEWRVEVRSANGELLHEQRFAVR